MNTTLAPENSGKLPEMIGNPGGLRSYPKIYNLGHRAIEDIFKDHVNIEEKVDGSQFSFGLYPVADTGDYELRCRSKGAELNVFAPERMFTKAIETVKSLETRLVRGWTYRGEFLAKPKHNALAYDRVPDGHIIIFDIEIGGKRFLTAPARKVEAERLGLEAVPVIYSGPVETIEFFSDLLNFVSILGGQKIEGVVVKNYNRFGLDANPLFGKYVSEAFKEVHKGEWRQSNPQSKDILLQLGTKYKVPARWAKCVQHLREAGKIEDAPKDIGLLIPEIKNDILEEEADNIKNALFKWAWPHISRMVTNGLPEWYKDQLLKRSFDGPEGQAVSESSSTVVCNPEQSRLEVS